MSGAASNAPIAINGYPQGNLVPGLFFSVDATQANTGADPQNALIIGQQLPGYQQAPYPVPAGTIDEVRALYGPGSMVSNAYQAFRKVNQTTPVFILPLSDDPASTGAVLQVKITGAAAEAGTFPFYADGQLVPIPVGVGQTGGTTATELTQAINLEYPDLPFRCNSLGAIAPNGGSFSLAAVNCGAVGNDLDARVAYLGAAAGEVVPAGLTVSITSVSTGTQNPTALAAALANCADQPFDYIVCPYSDPASLNALQAFLNDSVGRWSITRQIYGHGFSAVRGSLAQRTTFSAARNDQHASVIGAYDSPSSPVAWAAGLAAVAALSRQENPALPVTGFALPVLAPPIQSRDSYAARQTLLQGGMATFTVDSSGQVIIERVTTTYTTNPALGIPDDSYQDVETLFTLTDCLRDMRAYLGGLFYRNILVADGSPLPGGSKMITAQTVKAAMDGRYAIQCLTKGWAQNPDLFAAKSIARNVGKGVVQLLMPYEIANQLRVIAGSCQFTKP